VTALEARDHYYIDVNTDVCAFFGDYTANEGYAGSPTNSLILNFKKKMDKSGKPEWRYKLGAINTAAAQIATLMSPATLQSAVLVPMPPSKAIGDPLYDPRMTQTLGKVNDRFGGRLDIRDVLCFPNSQVASHERSDRPSPDDLYAAMGIRDDQVGDRDAVGEIWLFDDVLTTGAHFKAACRRLHEVYPNATIRGCFLARRALPNAADDFGPIDDDD
jgi:hypothetical protein